MRLSLFSTSSKSSSKLTSTLSWYIVLNFIILKGRPNRPILVCVKNTVPKSDNFIPIIAIIARGEVINSSNKAKIISQSRFR